MFAVVVVTFARRFKGDWRRACRCGAAKNSDCNRERRARHGGRVISLFHCHVESKEAKSRKVVWPPMNIDSQDSVLLLALIYLSGVLWHLDKATGKRSSPLWSLLWPLALWLNVHGKGAKRH
jgi:hypothetical protein